VRPYRQTSLFVRLRIVLLTVCSKLSQAIKTSVNEVGHNSRELKTSMGDLQTSISAVGQGVDMLQRDNNDQRRAAIIEWISPTKFPAQQSDIMRRSVEGTGQWFLDCSEFNNWLRDSKGTLFCPGIPGAGKTVLSAITITHLSRAIATSSNVGLAYIFCNYKEQFEHNVTPYLSALLKQLIQSQQIMPDSVSRLYDSHVGQGSNPSFGETRDALKSVIRGYQTVHIVIDALDECSDQRIRSQLLDTILTLQRDLDIHLMVTSRFIPLVEEKFKSAVWREIRASEEDVRRFLKGYLCNRCIQNDPVLLELVQEKIVQAADGMLVSNPTLY
jgi:hypothetical protein